MDANDSEQQGTGSAAGRQRRTIVACWNRRHRKLVATGAVLASLGCAVDERQISLSLVGASDAGEPRSTDTPNGGGSGGSGSPVLPGEPPNPQSGGTGGGGGGGGTPGQPRANTVSHDFGLVELQGSPGDFSWVIENAGDLALATGALTSSNSVDFLIENGCPAMLAGHATCGVRIRFAPSSIGLKTGELGLRAGSSALALSVTGTGGIRLDIQRIGGGTGNVLSDPPGISCGDTCSGLFNATSVRLEAHTTNGSDSFFSGWSAAECAGPVRDCTLSLNGPRSITATFQPLQSNLVFLSSAGLRTDLGNLEAYDAVCNQLATNAGINDAAGTGYLAALSTSTRDLRSRFASIATGWTRLDGRPFAANPAALLDQSQVLYPIRYSELGRDEATSGTNRDVYVITGSNPDGTRSASNCSDWTDATAAGQAEIGYPTGGATAWSTTIPIACNAVPYRVACFGRTKTGAVPVPAFSGKRVWLSNTPFLPGSISPDEQCTAERPAGVSAGRALLPYTDRPAMAVLDLNANYVRTDGQLVGTGQQIVDQTTLLTGIWLHGDGSPETARLAEAWSGYRDFTQPLPAAQTCDDWTSPAQAGFAGYVQTAELPFFYGSGIPQPCSGTFIYLYCVEP